MRNVNIGFILATLVSSSIGFITVPSLIYLNLKELVGTYTIILVSLNLLTAVFSMQLQQSYVRYFFKGYNTDKSYASMAIPSTAATVLFGVLFLIYTAFNHIEISMKYVTIILFFHLSNFLFMHWLRMSQNVLGYFAILVIPKFVFIFLIFTVPKSFVETTSIQLMYAVSIAVVSYPALKKLFSGINHFDFIIFQRYLKFSAPLILSTITWVAFMSLDKIVLSRFADEIFFNEYAIAASFSNIGAVSLNLFIVIWSRSVVEAESSGAFEILFENIFKKIILVSTLVFVALIYTSKFIVDIYIPEYLANWQIFKVLLISFVFLIASEMYNSVFGIIFKTGHILLLNIVSLTFFAASLLLLMVYEQLVFSHYAFLCAAVFNCAIKLLSITYFKPEIGVASGKALIFSIVISCIVVF